MRYCKLAGPSKALAKKSWHYEDQFCRPICKRHGANAMTTSNIEHVNCKGCLKVMKEKGIIKDDDEITYTIS